jgi:hypothetical protein
MNSIDYAYALAVAGHSIEEIRDQAEVSLGIAIEAVLEAERL